MFLKALTGSANLLSGWALAILILNFNFEKRKNTVLIVLIAITVILLSVSRGGFLTMVIFLVYVFFKEFNFKISVKPLFIGVFFLLLLLTYFLLSQKFPLPNIFERLTNTYDSGTLDSSSQLRLDKYAGLYDVWHQKLRYIVMGFGFDEEIVILNAKETVIDFAQE
jgi:O-antigen ligase